MDCEWRPTGFVESAAPLAAETLVPAEQQDSESESSIPIASMEKATAAVEDASPKISGK